MKKFLFPLFVLLALSFVLVSCEAEVEEPKYTVTFKDVDGSIISSVSVKGGGRVAEPENKPVEELGYKLVWLQDDSTEFDLSAPISSDLILKASLKNVGTYKVTFKKISNIGTGEAFQTIDEVSVTKGSKLANIPQSIATGADITGRTFLYWSKDKQNGLNAEDTDLRFCSKFDFSTTEITEDIILYPIYKPLIQVNYVSASNVYIKTDVITFEAEYNQVLTESEKSRIFTFDDSSLSEAYKQDKGYGISGDVAYTSKFLNNEYDFTRPSLKYIIIINLKIDK